MKKNKEKKTKLISIGQAITYVVWFGILLVMTVFLFSKRNAYSDEIDNKIQSNISRYGYVKSETWSRVDSLYYRVGDDSSIEIDLEFDIDGYILDSCSFKYKNYDVSSYKIDYYYDAINAILPDINIYRYKEQIENAIDNKLYFESDEYRIDILTEYGKNAYISIRDNKYNYSDYNYEIILNFSVVS